MKRDNVSSVKSMRKKSRVHRKEKRKTMKEGLSSITHAAQESYNEPFPFLSGTPEPFGPNGQAKRPKLFYDNTDKMPLETAETRNYGPTPDRINKEAPVSPKIYKLNKSSDELTPLNM